MRQTKLYLCSILLALAISSCSTEKTSTDYILSAKNYSDSGEYSAAVIEARNAVKADSNNAEARILLGKLELRNANYQSSEKELVKGIELGAKSNDVILELSQALLKQGKYDAVLELDSKTGPDKTKAALLAHQAAAHLALNNISAADTLASFAMELDARSTDTLVVMAKSAAYKNDLDISRKYISNALEISPNYAEAWELLGQLETREQNLDKAVVAFTRAIEHADNKLTPLLSRAQTYIELMKFDEANQDFTTIEKAGIKHPYVFLGKSEILFREGKYTEAQIQQEEALKLNPDFLPAVRGITLTHLVLGNHGQAEQYAKQLVSANESTSARALLGAVRLSSKRYEQAEIALTPLAQSGALDLTSSRMLSTIYLKQNKLEEAVELLLNSHHALIASGATEVPFLALDQEPAQALVNPDEVTGSDAEPYLSSLNTKIVDITSLVASSMQSEAFSAIDELQVQIPESSIPHSLRGRAFLLTEDIENAKASFENAASLSPASDIPIIMLAEIIRLENPAEATLLLDKELRDATGNSREKLMLRLASHSKRNDEPNTQLDWLKKAKEENSGSFQTNFALAQYYSENGNHADVLVAISSMSKVSQQIPVVADLQLRAMLKEKQFDDAILMLDNLVTHSAPSPNWYHLRAQAYAGKLDSERSILDLEHALKLDPDHYPSLAALADINIKLNDLSAAELYVEKLETLEPKSEALSYVKDNLIKAKLNPDEQEIKVQFKDTEGVLTGMKEFLKNEKPDLALLLANTWLTKNPHDVIIWTALGDTHGSLGQIPDAIQAYRKAIEITPDNFVALNNLAWYLRESEPENALKYVGDALKLKPNDVSTLDTLATIYLGQKNYAEAQRVFERAMSLGAKDPNIMYHGALIAFQQGNNAKARELLQPIIDSNVKFVERTNAEALFEKLN